MSISKFINKVFRMDARRLLGALPSESVDSVICDPMYMVAKKKGKNCTYDWGVEPGNGDAAEWWDYHREIYQECRRVLKPNGTLAWAMGCKFEPHFSDWFNGYRIWGFSRFFLRGVNAFGHIWVVQTKEQAPIAFPNDDALLVIGPRGWWREYHPCPKSEEEMRFMVRHLSRPGQIVLDCFAGTGSTLVEAKQLGRQWIGCDLSLRYCQIAMKRLAECHGDGAESFTPRGRRCLAKFDMQDDYSTPDWLFNLLNHQVKLLTGQWFQLVLKQARIPRPA